MRGIHYAGQLEGESDGGLVLDGLHDVIDLHTLTPAQRRACDLFGKCIGFPVVLVIAGLWMAVIWGAWGVRSLIAKFNRSHD